MSPELNFFITVALIAAATLAGYLARRLRWAPEKAAEPLMTFVLVGGYSSVGFLSIWALRRLDASAAWLPALGAVQVLVMLAACIAIGRLLFADRTEAGLFGVASGMGNNSFTMGAFIVYRIYGAEGLGLANIFCLMWTPLVVLALYPVARAFSTRRPEGTLGRLIFRSIFNWRSVGLPLAAVALVLSARGVPYPRVLHDAHVVDILMFTITPVAFFSIGLRLHLGSVWRYRKSILWLAVTRFGLAAGVGLALAVATRLTPWPLAGLGWNVFLIQAFVPTAVTMVVLANMFHLHPGQASVLFVVNSAMYLAIVLPVVMWLFR
ncbi:MAG TPA: hypothetical protein VNA25_08040 [Phycisphaerae bacterium]|nr:hypothetical protein [Phycisphaerae bacterium]